MSNVRSPARHLPLRHRSDRFWGRSPARHLLRSGHGHGHDPDFIDPDEVRRVTGVDGKVAGNRDRGDHRVVGTSIRLSAGPPQRGGDTPECAGSAGIEWERVEVGLGLLEMCLAGSPLALLIGDERTCRAPRA